MTSGAPAGVKKLNHEGQRRQITVMFCDMVGSTSLAGRLDPEDLREVLALYQELAVEAIERYAGYIAQFLGDGVVACFGYPQAHEDDAQRALYAALAILDGLDDLNARLRDEFGAIVQVRIGCHTGLVVAAATETGSGRDEFSMFGETPHIAARLQGVAQPGSVVVSDVTHALTRGYFETEALGEPALAGVSRPITVHRVVRATGVADRLEPISSERLTPLVGRGVEMEMLLAAWHGVREARGALVRVSGEPGIGKSRLVRALNDQLGDDLALAQRWQCSRHHQSTALYPVIRLLESRCELERGESEEAKAEKLHALVIAAGVEPDGAVPLLIDLLAPASNAGRRDRVADAQEERTALLHLLQSLLIADPAQHPMMLVVEDLQWADPTTLDLLWRVLGDLAELPVLCVFTHRQEFSWPWPRQPGMHIELAPLPPEDVRELAATVADAGLDEEVLRRVCDASDGIPLFVEEMLKMLALAQATDEAGSVTAEATVPATLNGLLTERLDRLSELGEVLDVAAVLGREFDRELLEALDPLGGGDVTPALGELVAHDVVRQMEGPPIRCEFKHALLHDAAYGRVLRRRRQQLHAQVASTLVERFAERVEREPELVAHHWSCAAAPAEAARYWRAAGIRALERAAFVEAAEHFRRGLAALDEADPRSVSPEQRADFLTYRGAALQAGHGYAAAGVEEAYAGARQVWAATGDDERLSVVIRGQWMLNLVAADYDAAYELAWEMLESAARRESGVALAEGHLYAGMVHMYRGQLESAREHLERAISSQWRPGRVDQIYEALGGYGAGAHAYLASVLASMGEERESLGHSERSLKLVEQVDQPVTRAQVWFMRAILHLGRAEPQEFVEWVEKTRAYSVDRNIRYWRSLASAYSNWGRAAAADREDGIPRLEATIESYLKSGARLGLVHLYVLLADLQLAGHPGAALESIALAEEEMARSGERLTEVELLRCKARVLMAGEQPREEAAIAELERAVEVAESQQARLPQLRALGQLVMQRRRVGADASADEGRLEEICQGFAADANLPDLRRARAILEPARDQA